MSEQVSQADGVWGILRSFLHETFSFGSIKAVVGRAGLDLSRMAHLEQVAGSGGATKSQVLSAIDLQVGPLDDDRRRQFERIVTEEMIRREPSIEPDLRTAFEKIGWTVAGGVPVERDLPRASVDHLTHLLNREALDRDVSARIAEARIDGRPLGAVFVDLDHFKKVNDERGHSAGDGVLKGVAATLQSIAEGKGRVYRYGGEEIVLLLPNHSPDEATAVAERARRTLKGQPIHGLSVTASFGVACFPDHADSAPHLLQAADRAVYEAKSLGRNLVRVSGEPPPRNEERTERKPARKVAQPGGLSA